MLRNEAGVNGMFSRKRKSEVTERKEIAPAPSFWTSMKRVGRLTASIGIGVIVGAGIGFLVAGPIGAIAGGMTGGIVAALTGDAVYRATKGLLKRLVGALIAGVQGISLGKKKRDLTQEVTPDLPPARAEGVVRSVEYKAPKDEDTEGTLVFHTVRKPQAAAIQQNDVSELQAPGWNHFIKK